jgi:predicted Zn-dependent peptidase
LLQKKNVKNISLDDLVDYHKKNYTSKNTFFFVSGDFNPAYVLSVFKTKLKSASLSGPGPSSIENIPSKNPFSYQSKLFFVENKTEEAKNGGVNFNIYFPLDIHLNNELLQHLILTCSLIELEIYNILRIEHKLIYSISVSSATYYFGTVVEITGSCMDVNFVKILKYIIEYLRVKKVKNVDSKLLNNSKKLLLLHRSNHIKNSMEIAEFYESQYLLIQLQQRYRNNENEKDHQDQQEDKKMVCKIYSEKEFDKALETIDATHVRKIINMLDFSSVIIGYMAKKNLRLTLSDFI